MPEVILDEFRKMLKNQKVSSSSEFAYKLSKPKIEVQSSKEQRLRNNKDNETSVNQAPKAKKRRMLR